MIPVPPFLAENAIKLAGMLVLVAALLGLYFYWHGKVYDSGYSEAETLYKARELQVYIDSQKLLSKKEKEIDKINDENRERTLNAVQIYNDHYADVIASRERLPINTAKTDSSRNAMPRSSCDTGGSESSNPRIHEPRITEEIVRKVEDGQLACERLLNMFDLTPQEK